jgi:hypothetical protein
VDDDLAKHSKVSTIRERERKRDRNRDREKRRKKRKRTRDVMTNTYVITRYFLPLIAKLVEACNTVSPSTDKVHEFVSCFVNLYLYFQHFDWVATWNSAEVVTAWRWHWLSYHEREARADNLLDAEHPTVDDVDFLKDLFVHLLTPLSVPLPQLPVYHCSHHGLQALQGVVAKQL